MPLISEIAHQMGIIPLLMLSCLWAVEERRDPSLWWLSGVFAVSWLADTAAHWVNPQLISAVYPVSQAALVASVLLKRDDAITFLFAITSIGIASIIFQEFRQPSILRLVAWAAIVTIVYPLPLGRVRYSLLTTFGVGLIAWIVFATIPSWGTWYIYQAVRAIGIMMFCWAAAARQQTKITLILARA